jgi:hypothetical protein
MSVTFLFHERQSRMRCGIHAVNNLLQAPVYDVTSFQRLIAALPPEGGPYQSFFVGNFDGSVLLRALVQSGLSAKQHDRRMAFVLGFSGLQSGLMLVGRRV